MTLRENEINFLREIADQEILTSLFMNDYSLMNGQTGVMLFFALLGRATGNHWYEDFADELLESVCNNISRRLPVNFAEGLCGIGWAIEFLKYHGFLDVDTDEILSEIDEAVMERDVRRIKDMSLETGLQGIYAYVISRVSSARKNDVVPFDSIYISDVQTKLLENGIDSGIDIFDIDTVWSRVLSFFSGNYINNLWRDAILFLERGTSIPRQKLISVDESKFDYLDRLYISSKDCVFLIINECLGMQYGLSTYLRNHVKALDPERYDVNVLMFDSSAYKFERINEIAYFNLPSIKLSSTKKLIENSYFYYIANKIGVHRNILCHFNLYGNATLIELLKNELAAKIIFTVHFTHWGLQLGGKTESMQHILSLPPESLTSKESDIYNCFLLEKRTFQSCDAIICPSTNTYNYLNKIYNIHENRLHLVPHVIDVGSSILPSKEVLRNKYGFVDTDKIVIYVGRIDRNKGVFDLIDAVKQLTSTNQHIRLLIVGAGFLNEALNAAVPCRNNIFFMGFQDKSIVRELLHIADLGVVPSHYEEFGYVALEMAYSGIPVIVSEVGGLTDIACQFPNVSIFSYEEENSLISQIRNHLNDSEGYSITNTSEKYIKQNQANISTYSSRIAGIYNSYKQES